MQYRTGQTIFENVLSLDADNNPVSAATFDVVSLRDGLTYTGVTLNVTISDGSRGLFTASWSADTTGDYQFYMKNNITNVIFITDVTNILPDSSFDQNIYIGL
jgi:hypothetical protein